MEPDTIPSESNNNVPPDTTAEINKNGIVFLRQARLFSDEPVEVERFSWDELDGDKILIEDISAMSSTTTDSNGISITLQDARVSFGRQTEAEITQKQISNSPSTKRIWSGLEERYGIRYDYDEGEIEFDSSESDKDNYVNFFTYLANESMLSRLGIPYKAKTAKNYTLNEEPKLREDKRMARPVEITGGIWLETQIPKSQKKTNMSRVVNEITGGDG